MFTVGHMTKHVYLCMSQYSSTCHIITNVKHLLQWRNIQNTTQLRAKKMPNAKTK